ncbi:uncharacterized protein ARMOST_20946 [Armillaria ostoyae]|uniref:Uncharacterized protein n=1 Tax=Armillaria ostoyae TaxID=47428 RepID=A0A284S8V4_ARMOS|nr:uncharacterized protein ARMOST_20946 [Armillaria ostoyae]
MEGDPEYGATVQRLRTRTCTNADVELFNWRVVWSEEVPDGIDMKGVDSVAVVRTNLLRHVINSYKAMSDCTERELLTCAAVDKVRGTIVPAEMRDKLLNRDTTSLQHKGALPGYLSFYIGMPVILRSRNILTDLKVTNGAQGVLRHLQMGVDAHGKRYGQCAIVEFPGGDFQLDGLPPRCFLITPTTWTFHEKMKNEDGELVTVHVRREQLPFQPGFACTGHVAQGQTMKSVLAYLHEGSFAASVAVSRATSWKGMYLAEKVKIGHLTKDLPPALVDEMARFEQMAQNTLQKYQLDPKLSPSKASTAQIPYSIDFDRPTSVPKKMKRKKPVVADVISPATSSKKVRVKGPLVSSLAASTFGNKWDSLNWSCAYDSFFTSLYHVYTERNQVWRRQMCIGVISQSCCGLFEQVPTAALQHDSLYLDEA